MFLIYAFFLGFIPALIAKGKGRSFGLWWLYGAAIFIVALPHSLLIEKSLTSGKFKKCHACAEIVKNEALVCRYCGISLS